MTSAASSVRARCATRLTGRGAGAQGAIALIDVVGDSKAELEATIGRVVGAVPAVGHAAVRSIGRVDEGVVARVSEVHIQLTPHGGRAVRDAICFVLREAGIAVDEANDTAQAAQTSRGFGHADPWSVYPEASDHVEACALDAIAHAPSPRAVDAIAHQVSVWRDEASEPVSGDDGKRLDRLLHPPTVAVIGRANIGKSTLTNALARRGVAIVADEPGTTRDHVGVTLELARVCVRWLDTPGVHDVSAAHVGRPDGAIEAAALDRARETAEAADLLVVCADHAGAVPTPEELGYTWSGGLVRCRLRCDRDRGWVPESEDARTIEPGIVRTSAITSGGLVALASAVSEALVPRALDATPGRWRFHPML